MGGLGPFDCRRRRLTWGRDHEHKPLRILMRFVFVISTPRASARMRADRRTADRRQSPGELPCSPAISA